MPSLLCLSQPAIISMNSSKSRVPDPSSSTSSMMLLMSSSVNLLSNSRKISFRVSVEINPMQSLSYILKASLRSFFINLLNDLSEGRRLHFHPHHGEDSSHLVSRNGALLIGETVKALFQNLDLVRLEANGVHLLLGEKLLVSHVECSRPALCVREVFAAF